jgi:hypothetical protein
VNLRELSLTAIVGTAGLGTGTWGLGAGVLFAEASPFLAGSPLRTLGPVSRVRDANDALHQPASQSVNGFIKLTQIIQFLVLLVNRKSIHH